MRNSGTCRQGCGLQFGFVQFGSLVVCANGLAAASSWGLGKQAKSGGRVSTWWTDDWFRER